MRFELRPVDLLSLAHMGVDEGLLIPSVGEILHQWGSLMSIFYPPEMKSVPHLKYKPKTLS